MKKSSFASFILALAYSTGSSALVLNGGFEINSSVGCDFNLSNSQFNARMSNATAFGNSRSGLGEIDIMKGSCLGASGAHSGTTYVGLHTFKATERDLLSLTLSGALVAGTSYQLSLFAQGQGVADKFDIGLSSVATSFGSTLASTTVAFGSWQNRSYTFLASGGESFLTFRAGTTGNHYVFLDTIALAQAAPVPEPATWGLFGIGMYGIAAWRRRTKVKLR